MTGACLSAFPWGAVISASSILFPPFTPFPKNAGQDSTPPSACGSFPANLIHGGGRPRQTRMDKILKSSENRNIGHITTLFIRPRRECKEDDDS